MTDMYLLFEWTEEREAKMHLGIFTSIEKAKAAAEKLWKHELIDDRGAEEHEIDAEPLNWTPHRHGDGWTGEKKELADPDLVNRYDVEVPYDIEVFTVDTVSIWSRVKNEETGRYESVREVHEL